MNLAVLTDQRIQRSITVLGARRSGVVSVVSSSLTCTSADSEAIQVDGACGFVFLNGSETGGTAATLVTVTYNGTLTAEVPLRVWYPDLPVRWQVADSTLHAVADWLDDSRACAQRYQRTSIAVHATFRCNTTASFEVNVTPRLLGKLSSSNTSVASFAAGSAVLNGQAPGTCALAVNVSRSSAVGTLAMTVSASAVHVLYLTVTPVKAIVLSGLSSTMLANSTQLLTASIQQTLTREFESAYVYVTAVLSNGQQFAVSLADGVTLTSLNAAVVTVVGSNISATGSGSGTNVSAALQGGSCSGNKTLGTGLGTVDVALPAPTGVEISVAAWRLTVVGDPAALTGVPTQSSITVRLVYGDGSRQDMTNDSRTVYDDSLLDSSDLFIVARDGNGLPVLRASGAAGNASLLVRFLHVSVNSTQAVRVVLAAAASLASSPYPSFSGSDAVADSTLNLIGETGVYQQLYLRLTLLMTDGAAVGISTATSTSYQQHVVGSSTPSTSFVQIGGSAKNIVSKRSNDTDGSVDIVGIFAGAITSNALTVTVNSSKIVIQSISNIVFPSTLSGVAGSTTQVQFDVTFSDSSKWLAASLFPSGALVLQNLVTFSTSDSSVAAVNSTSGVVTLLRNDDRSNTLTIQAVDAGAVQGSKQFEPNLQPAVGDVDLGGTSGVPLAAQTVGSQFAVRVRVSIGTTALRSIQLAVAYDAGKLQIVSVGVGSGWPGGPFQANTDTAGLVNFGGACDAVTGTPELAIIQFKVLGAGSSRIYGSVITLADGSGGSIPSGALANRAFVAGNISVVLTGSRRRDGDRLDGAAETAATAAESVLSEDSSLAAAAEHPESGSSGSHTALLALLARVHSRRSGEVACANKPCATCSAGRQTGDTDGDCLFDVRDVTYQRDYLNLAAANPSSPPAVLPSQFRNLDTDQNGQANAQDVDYLLKVNFGLYKFVTAVNVTPVTESNNCQLSITVTLTSGGAGAGDAPADSSTTFLFIDLEASNSSFSQQLASSVVRTGSSTQVVKGTGYHGTLFRASALGSGLFGIVLDSAVAMSNIGLSLVLGSFDGDGSASDSRLSPLLVGPLDSAPEFSSPLAVTLPISASVSLSLRSGGYSPFAHFDSWITSAVCQNLRTTSSTVTTTSSTILITTSTTEHTVSDSTTSGLTGPTSTATSTPTTFIVSTSNQTTTNTFPLDAVASSSLIVGSGQIASLVAVIILAIALLCLHIFKLQRDLHGRIIFSFIVALLLALVFFVFFASRRNYFSFEISATACSAGGALFQFFFMASMLWLLIEFIDQYFESVDAFARKPFKRFLKYSLVAWGLPLLFVVCLAAIKSSIYGGDEVCWFDGVNDRWAFILIPSLLIFLNALFFIGLQVRRVHVSTSSYDLTGTPVDRTLTLRRRAGLIVFLLLVLAWILTALALYLDAGFMGAAVTLHILLALAIFFVYVIARQRAQRQQFYVTARHKAPMLVSMDHRVRTSTMQSAWPEQSFAFSRNNVDPLDDRAPRDIVLGSLWDQPTGGHEHENVRNPIFEEASTAPNQTNSTFKRFSGVVANPLYASTSGEAEDIVELALESPGVDGALSQGEENSAPAFSSETAKRGFLGLGFEVDDLLLSQEHPTRKFTFTNQSGAAGVFDPEDETCVDEDASDVSEPELPAYESEGEEGIDPADKLERERAAVVEFARRQREKQAKAAAAEAKKKKRPSLKPVLVSDRPKEQRPPAGSATIEPKRRPSEAPPAAAVKPKYEPSVQQAQVRSADVVSILPPAYTPDDESTEVLAARLSKKEADEKAAIIRIQREKLKQGDTADMFYAEPAVSAPSAVKDTFSVPTEATTSSSEPQRASSTKRSSSTSKPLPSEPVPALPSGGPHSADGLQGPLRRDATHSTRSVQGRRLPSVQDSSLEEDLHSLPPTML
eukprot:m.895784 g.895784  ORF g.895784 m.895784 type:complete len:1904 (+) comp60002_c0_seq1:1304-7015(+)